MLFLPLIIYLICLAEMNKTFARQIFSFVFLFIFFVKMFISVAPLIAERMDSKVIMAVIMQLEIENHSSKAGDQAKESLTKGEWLSGFYKFNFSQPHDIIEVNQCTSLHSRPIRVFYPSVPTPPPNS